MKILVVAQTYPWPQTTGARMRLGAVLRGLRRLGEIDLFVLADPDQGEGSPAAHDLPVERVTVLKCPRVLRDRPRAGLWIVWAGLFLGTYFTRLWKLFGAGPGAWKGFGFAVGSSLGPVTLGAAILACIWAVGPRLAGRLASGGRNRKAVLLFMAIIGFAAAASEGSAARRTKAYGKAHSDKRRLT